MATIRDVYHRDLHAILKNPAALLTVFVLCILPSLYTLVNVSAIWNPYRPSETHHIAVAVVNQDQGTALRGKSVNLGKAVVNKLHDNHQIGWRFVDAQTANDQLKQGNYYAEIIIPKNFSRRLASIATAHPQRATVIYRTNTKDSPMGLKMTETAAKSLVNQIQQNLVYNVNKIAFSYLNQLGDKAHHNESEMMNLKDLIIALGDSMDLATASVSTIHDTASDMGVALAAFKPVITQAQHVDVVGDANGALKDQLTTTKSAVNRGFADFSTDLSTAAAQAQTVNRLAKQLGRRASATNRGLINRQIETLSTQLTLLKSQVTPLNAFLKTVNQQKNLAQLNGLEAMLGGTQALINQQTASLTALKKGVNTTGQVNQRLYDQLLSQSQRTADKTRLLVGQYQREVRTGTNAVGDHLIATITQSQQLLTTLKRGSALNEKMLTTMIQGNQLVATSTGKLEDKLTAGKATIVGVSNRLKLTSDRNMAAIISVLQSSPGLMGSTLAKPFNIKNEDIYRVTSFGAAFAPSYMALSIWVGCTMLVAVLYTAAPREGKLRKLTDRTEYLGKLMIFMTLSLIQTLIVTLSTMFILPIHAESPLLLLLTGGIISIGFMIIIYTLVCLFGNLGKALVVALLATQLAGSGAIYPIQLSPLAFRLIQPLFPFAYGVNGFREAIGGPNIGTVATNFFVLAVMAGVMLWLGLLTKRPLRHQTDLLTRDFQKTGLGQ